MAGESAFGTAFGVSTGVSALDLSTRPSTWNYIGDLTNISGPSISVDTIDVTAHDSADAAREFVAGVIDGGDITLEGNFTDAASGEELTDLIDTRSIISFIVKFPTTGTHATSTVNMEAWLFTGAFVGLETDAPFDGKIGFSASVKLSGKPFLTSTYTSSE